MAEVSPDISVDAPPSPGVAPVPPQMRGMCQDIESDVQNRLVQSQAVILKTMVCPLLQATIQSVKEHSWEPGLNALMEQELPIAINAALEELPQILSEIIDKFLGEKTVGTLKRMADGTYECEFPCNCDESCTGAIAASAPKKPESLSQDQDQSMDCAGGEQNEQIEEEAEAPCSRSPSTESGCSSCSAPRSRARSASRGRCCPRANQSRRRSCGSGITRCPRTAPAANFSGSSPYSFEANGGIDPMFTSSPMAQRSCGSMIASCPRTAPAANFSGSSPYSFEANGGIDPRFTSSPIAQRGLNQSQMLGSPVPMTSGSGGNSGSGGTCSRTATRTGTGTGTGTCSRSPAEVFQMGLSDAITSSGTGSCGRSGGNTNNGGVCTRSATAPRSTSASWPTDSNEDEFIPSRRRRESSAMASSADEFIPSRSGNGRNTSYKSSDASASGSGASAGGLFNMNLGPPRCLASNNATPVITATPPTSLNASFASNFSPPSCFARNNNTTTTPVAPGFVTPPNLRNTAPDVPPSSQRPWNYEPMDGGECCARGVYMGEGFCVPGSPKHTGFSHIEDPGTDFRLNFPDANRGTPIIKLDPKRQDVLQRQEAAARAAAASGAPQAQCRRRVAPLPGLTMAENNFLERPARFFNQANPSRTPPRVNNPFQANPPRRPRNPCDVLSDSFRWNHSPQGPSSPPAWSPQ